MARKKDTSEGAALARGRYVPPPLDPLEDITVEPSEAFLDALFGELRRLQEAKERAHRVPDHVLHRADFLRHVATALNALYTSGRISVGLTINDRYINTRPSEGDTAEAPQ